jgi:tRNA dimethylallyltransferase
MMVERKQILAIVGATASGKSSVAQRVADKTGASLVSVDSRKIYRGMDIGTAKPAPDLRERYRYGMIDCADPDERFSAGQYVREARALVGERLERGERVILVGGSGFYLEAFVRGLPDLPAIDPQVRAGVLADAEARGWEALHADLLKTDPAWAMSIEPTDKTRLLRATETLKQTGKPLSEWLRATEKEAAPWPTDIVELEHDRQDLHERIAARTDRMIAAGLVSETEGLLRRGYTAKSPGLATVGYQEIISHLEGRISVYEARDQIVFHTRQYAKRQLTWFRHRPGIRQIRLEDAAIQSLIDTFEAQ